MHQTKAGKHDSDSGIAIPFHGIKNKVESNAIIANKNAKRLILCSNLFFFNVIPILINENASKIKNEADTIK